MEHWLAAGQGYELFWRLTPAEINRILEGCAKARRMRFEEQRQISHELAGLISYAFHDPKKLPKYEPVTGAKQDEKTGEPPVSQELQHAQVRGYFIGLAMRNGAKSRP